MSRLFFRLEVERGLGVGCGVSAPFAPTMRLSHLVPPVAVQVRAEAYVGSGQYARATKPSHLPVGCQAQAQP
jgi:hypothetical protein